MRTLPEARRRRKRLAQIAGVIVALMLLWGIWIFSNFMADAEKDEFRKTCEALNSEPFFEGGDWLCIRDGEVVYG